MNLNRQSTSLGKLGKPHLNRKFLFWLVLLFVSLALASCDDGKVLVDSSTTTAVPAAVEKDQEGVDSSPVSPSSLSSPQEPFDIFIDESYRQLLARDPERVINMGLQDTFEGIDEELTDISAEYSEETTRLQQAVLSKLQTFNRMELSKEQQLTYDIYAWYLDDQVRAGSYPFHDYPLTHFFTAEHNQIIHFFTEIHPITTREDAEDYITRLSKLGTKFNQLEEGLRLRQEAGIIPPRYILERAHGQVGSIANSLTVSTPFYSVFVEKLEALDDLSESDRLSLEKSAETAIEESVLPAYHSLLAALSDLEQTAPEEIGVWRLPEGDLYYQHLLRHYTTTDLTADEIHQIGLQELESIQTEMRLLSDELDYPQSESIPELYARAARNGGMVTRPEIVRTYEQIIAGAAASLDGISTLHPEADVVVKGAPSGGFYVAPAIDGSRPGVFYATLSSSLPHFAMPTLAYHEAIPGHHFQIAIAQDLDLPLVRNTTNFGAFVEGWALYAERLAWENGLYADDPYGDLGRLQAEAFRAARLVVDTGIHAEGWTRDRAIQFMVSNTGLPTPMVADQVDRYVVLPGQATAYSIGMLKILELRSLAQGQLGDHFGYVEYNDLILSQGSMPLVVLEQVVDDYISKQLNGRS